MKRESLIRFASPHALPPPDDDRRSGFHTLRQLLWMLLGRSGREDIQLTHKVLDQETKGTYICQDLECTVDEHVIPAYLLLPVELEGQKIPGVVVVHSNASDYAMGRKKVMEDSKFQDERVAPELAERKFAVLTFDLMGFGDRKASCHPYHLAKRDEHAVGMHNIWSYLLTEGKTLLGENLRELQAAVSILQQCAAVDPEKIGVIGHSGGGIQSLFLTALDQRVKVGVSVCGVSSNRQKKEAGVKLDDTLVIPKMSTLFGDLDLVLMLTGGRNLLSISAGDDCYSLGAEQMVQNALSSLPAPLQTIESRVFPGPHQFSAEMRKVAYEFLDRYLR